jgi:hypothetical protein
VNYILPAARCTPLASIELNTRMSMRYARRNRDIKDPGSGGIAHLVAIARPESKEIGRQTT